MAADFVCNRCCSGADKVHLKEIPYINRLIVTEQEDGDDLWNELWNMNLDDIGFPQLALITVTGGSFADSEIQYVVELTADADLLMGSAALTSVRKNGS